MSVRSTASEPSLPVRAGTDRRCRSPMHGPSSMVSPSSRPPHGLAFGVLGSLTVTRDGRSVEIPAGRQQVVLAALLSEPGRVVGTDHLVDAIWGENPPATARAQVQICVSRLRKSLAGARSEERRVGKAARAR